MSNSSSPLWPADSPPVMAHVNLKTLNQLGKDEQSISSREDAMKLLSAAALLLAKSGRCHFQNRPLSFLD